MGFRFSLVVSALFLGYVFLLFHLYNLQLKNGEVYFAQAESQNGAATLTASLRGAIYMTDRDGNKIPAALNQYFPEVYAAPKVMSDPALAAQTAAEIFARPFSELQKTFRDKSKSYVSLQKHASDDVVQKVQNSGIKGLYVEQVPDRFYPFGPMASQVLGFVGPNNVGNGESGRYGLEKFYESKLAGSDTSALEGVVSGGSGEDITLTLDSNIQKEAEISLQKMVEVHKAESGTGIVEDPNTGKILAMGGFPNFDPNNYGASDISNFLDPNTEKVYEPGSVMKVVTMAAGIDSGKITPDTTYVDAGKLVIYDKVIQNWDLKAHGVQTMTNVIEKSLNTGAVFAERTMGNDIFRNYLMNFGFGEKTGIDLPGEIGGNLKNIAKGGAPVNFATASFGQGISVTPLQVINAVSALANGGILMRPYLNADLKPQEVRRVISGDTAQKVIAMMVSAVDKANVVSVPGYTIAGKSGTAQIADFKKGGYSDQVTDSFVGFAPANNPSFIILITLSKPQGAPLAGTTVLPAFKDLTQFILNYYNVPPDRADNKK
jgi:cell division protein FtsI/penicillin-binding protein 2